MHNQKFIIGLPSEVPSTRILKPPGGECHDIFGLKSRQKALRETLSRRQSKVNNDDFPLQRLYRYNPVESFKTVQTGNQKEKKYYLETNQTNDIKQDKERRKESFVMCDEQEPLKKINEETQHTTIKEDTEKVFEVKNMPLKYKNTITLPTKSSIQKVISRGVSPKTNDIDPKTSNKNLQNLLTSTSTKNPASFVRNPITGKLSDLCVRSKSDTNTMNLTASLNTSQHKDLDLTGNSKEISAFKPNSTQYVRRNPITGENTSGNTYYFGHDQPKRKRAYPHPTTQLFF